MANPRRGPFGDDQDNGGYVAYRFVAGNRGL